MHQFKTKSADGSRDAEPRLKLSRHFCARWREKFGGEPSLRRVRKVLRESIWLQKTHDMLFPVSKNPHRTLSIYVHFGRQVAIKVDEINNVVVTMVWSGQRTENPEECLAHPPSPAGYGGTGRRSDAGGSDEA